MRLFLAIVLAILLTGGKRRLTGHVHEGSLGTIAAHEEGHKIAAEYVRGKVIKTKVFSDGSGGYVTADGLNDPKSLLIFYMGGAAAINSREGTDYDYQLVDKVMRTLPSDVRYKMYHEANSEVKQLMSRNSSRIKKAVKRYE